MQKARHDPSKLKMLNWVAALSEVVEIPEAPEARHERRSEGIEATELLGKACSELPKRRQFV